jgi:hypothetical protein
MRSDVVVAHLAGVVGCALLGAVIAYQVPVFYGGIGEEFDGVGLCWICVLLYMTLLTGFFVEAFRLLFVGAEAWTGKVVWRTFLVNSFIVVIYSATAATALQ